MKAIRALALIAALLPCVAFGQSAPSTLGYHTVYGRLGATPGDSGPGSAIPFATLQAQFSSVSQPVFPPTIASPNGIANGHFLPWLDENVQFSGGGVTPFGVFSTEPIIIGAAGSSIGSSTAGQTFSVRFTSTAFAGPITATYTAVNGDTTATIAAGLCNAINSNTTLNSLVLGSNNVPVQSQLPVFCQSFSGSATFNIQWAAAFAPSGATPLTLSSVGTGTVNIAATVDQLDYTVNQFARHATGRTAPLAGDNLTCFVFTGDSTAGFDTNYGQICVNAPNVTSGAQQGRFQFNAASGSGTARPIFYASQGLVLYDSSHASATGGDLGFGTINVPASYALAGSIIANSAGLFTPGNNLFGGIGAGSALNLQSTQSGSPSGDFVQITTGGAVREKIFNSGGISYGGAADPGAPGILNVLTGFRIGNGAGSGHVLRGNGTNFVDAALAAADLSNGVTGTGSVVLSANPNMTGTATVSGGLIAGASSTSIGGTTLLAHSGTDQNFAMVGPINLANGVAFLSVNDANNATKGIQFNASQVYYNAPISIGTTTNPGSTNLLVAGSALSNTASGGVGYATGSGGAVTQLTSRTTGVTLNNVTGAITLFAAAPAVGTWVSFTVTDSAVAATDVPHVSFKSGTNTYIGHVTAVAAGSFQISFTSIVGTTSDSPVINFAIIKGSAS